MYINNSKIVLLTDENKIYTLGYIIPYDKVIGYLFSENNIITIVFSDKELNFKNNEFIQDVIQIFKDNHVPLWVNRL
jgi:hypothetical protein